MNKQELVTVLRDALQAEGAVEVFPDPDSLPEQAGIRLCGNASLSRIADAIIAKLEERTLWLALHHHRHGVDTFFVRAESEPTREEFITTCEIDFEPDREEYIDIFHINPGWIKELSSRPSDCECDNTHEQNNTCCTPCWNAGFRRVARPS